MNTRDLKQDNAIFALFKGDPKTGKSIAAHSFPDTYTFLFDIARMKSVKNFHLFKDRDFEYDPFDPFDPSALIKVNQTLEGFKQDCPFKTIIFDGLTKFSNLAIECMIQFRNPSSNSKTVRAGIPMTEIEDYGGHDRAITMALNSMLSIHLKHKTNIIVIAHVLTVETKNIKNNTVTVSRSLLTAGQKIAAKMPVDFNECYHFYVNSSMDPNDLEPRFTAVTKSNSVDWASSVIGLPTVIDWTNKKFYDEIERNIAGKEFFV